MLSIGLRQEKYTMTSVESKIPIYLQLVSFIEDQIIDQTLKENERVYSKMQLAEAFTVNPITALKALNYLEEQGIIYVRRGVGMFVSEDAITMITKRRKTYLLETQLELIVSEARKLGVKQEEMKEALERVWEDVEG